MVNISELGQKPGGVLKSKKLVMLNLRRYFMSGVPLVLAVSVARSYIIRASDVTAMGDRRSLGLLYFRKTSSAFVLAVR